MNANYYEILEIPSDADDREIKRAYHRLARELHPDKAASPEEARKVEDRFALVSAAYNALKDPDKRAEYNKTAKGSSKANGNGAAAPPPGSTAASRVLNAPRGRAAGGVVGAGPSAPGASPSPAPQANGAANAKPAAMITPERIAIAQKAFARGMQFCKDGNHSKAIDFFEAAIQNNDQEAIYHARLAMSLIREKRSATRAIDAAQRAIDLDPYNLEHKFNLAFIYETIESKTNAVRIYEEILKWDNGNQRAKLAMQELHRNKRAPFGLSFGGGGNGSGEGGLMQKLLGRFKK
jgi:curved DNA-binding protein CbpA